MEVLDKFSKDFSGDSLLKNKNWYESQSSSVKFQRRNFILKSRYFGDIKDENQKISLNSAYANEGNINNKNSIMTL